MINERRVLALVSVTCKKMAQNADYLPYSARQSAQW